MNKVITPLIAILVCGLVVFIDSCKKKDVNLGARPEIAFKTGSGYVSVNTTLQQGDTVTIGINANNSGSIDKLTKLVVRRSLPDAEYTTIKDIKIDNLETYTYDLTLVLATLGSQNYKFIVVNAHGLETEAILTLKVVP
jgi:hypothetical protein